MNHRLLVRAANSQVPDAQRSLFPTPQMNEDAVRHPDRPRRHLRDEPLLALPDASSAVAPDSLSIAIQTIPPAPRGTLGGKRPYVRAVLARYLWLPDTPCRSSRHDRRLASVLYERGVALLVVEAALLLAAARRALREPWLAPLPRVRSLHYYLPVISEVLDNPRAPDVEYLTCLLRRLRPLAELKVARLAHEQSYGRGGMKSDKSTVREGGGTRKGRRHRQERCCSEV
jgi:hypothetical protein